MGSSARRYAQHQALTWKLCTSESSCIENQKDNKWIPTPFEMHQEDENACNASTIKFNDHTAQHFTSSPTSSGKRSSAPTKRMKYVSPPAETTSSAPSLIEQASNEIVYLVRKQEGIAMTASSSRLPERLTTWKDVGGAKIEIGSTKVTTSLNTGL
ncbi:hypothetical protein PLICRDRAFT_210747 [Plicaturopsis crispa FD-325 SS-3]|nr:hypothetical protein PLICRDRAFT_210747 [Plicaturopsis crispa FD-325 SS-3]